MQIEANGTRLWFDTLELRGLRRRPALSLRRRRHRRADRVVCPTLVCVGALDPATPVAAAREIIDALPRTGRLEVIENAGHFPWLDCPDRYWQVVKAFVADALDC